MEFTWRNLNPFSGESFLDFRVRTPESLWICSAVLKIEFNGGRGNKGE
jgi:hypothetical protein